MEDIRVLRYQRLKNLAGPAAVYFAATFLGQILKLYILCEKLLISLQRLFGIPLLRFYAPTDGIRAVFTGAKLSPPPESPRNLQLELLLAWQSLKK